MISCKKMVSFVALVAYFLFLSLVLGGCGGPTAPAYLPFKQQVENASKEGLVHQTKTDFFEKINTPRKLRKMWNTRASEGEASWFYFSLPGIFGSSSGSGLGSAKLKEEPYIYFAWELDGVYRILKTPLDRCNVIFNDKCATPYVKFIWYDSINTNWKMTNFNPEKYTLTHFVKPEWKPHVRDWLADYWSGEITIFCREEDWPESLDLPMNKTPKTPQKQ